MATEAASIVEAGRALLGDTSFRNFFAARLISAFGTAMAPVAMAFGVLDLTGSARDVGLVIASMTASQVAVQLFGGALADRWSRKYMIVCADLIAAASQLAMAWILLSGQGSIAALCGLMAINGVSFALHWPAAVGIVPQVVPREKLQPANALLSLAGSSAMGLGGACAGVLVATAGAGWAIAVDAATFCASALLIASIRVSPQARGEAGGSLVSELREGFREFVAHRWLWAIVLQFSLVVMAWNGGFLVIGPVVAEQSLGGATSWGWVAGALGFGLFAGGLLGMRLQVQRPMVVCTFAVLTFSLPLLCLIEPMPLWVIAGSAFVAGVGGELFGVLWNTALHTHVAPEALSRVSAYDVLGSIALAPLGEALAGPLFEAMGRESTLTLGVVLIIVPTLLVFTVPEVRTLGPTSGRPLDP